jgi:hypothetical protein
MLVAVLQAVAVVELDLVLVPYHQLVAQVAAVMVVTADHHQLHLLLEQ